MSRQKSKRSPVRQRTIRIAVATILVATAMLLGDLLPLRDEYQKHLRACRELQSQNQEKLDAIASFRAQLLQEHNVQAAAQEETQLTWAQNPRELSETGRDGRHAIQHPLDVLQLLHRHGIQPTRFARIDASNSTELEFRSQFDGGKGALMELAMCSDVLHVGTLSCTADEDGTGVWRLTLEPSEQAP